MSQDELDQHEFLNKLAKHIFKDDLRKIFDSVEFIDEDHIFADGKEYEIKTYGGIS